jgi:hypothetical protein
MRKDGNRWDAWDNGTARTGRAGADWGVHIPFYLVGIQWTGQEHLSTDLVVQARVAGRFGTERD